MGRRALALLAIVIAAGCPGDSDDAPAEPRPAPTVIAPIDAAVVPSDGGITQIRGFDPASGMHLDDADEAPIAGGYGRPRNRRYLEILLRSTPSGATAYVDGQQVGKTPMLWEGDFTGREREFTFVLRGYSLGRYRFVPIQNGIVHARLTSLIGDDDPLHRSGIPVEALPPTPAPPTPRRPAVAPTRVPDASTAPADAGAATLTPSTPSRPPADTGFGPPP